MPRIAWANINVTVIGIDLTLCVFSTWARFIFVPRHWSEIQASRVPAVRGIERGWRGRARTKIQTQAQHSGEKTDTRIGRTS
jgi:hypothetical protein